MKKTMFLLAGLVLCSAGDSSGQSHRLFDTWVKYAVGTDPSGVVAADFNGDGFPDLAVSNAGSHDVSVLTNQGDGTFGEAYDYHSGDSCIWLITHDMDGDGDLDLITVNQSPASVSILFNTGNALFLAHRDYAVSITPTSMVAADFSGDGHPDLAIASRLSDSLIILVNDGALGFSEKSTYAVGAHTYSLGAADLDGDGDQDLAVHANAVRLFTNLGDGRFDPNSDSIGWVGPFGSLELLDYDQDGHIDIVYTWSIPLLFIPSTLGLFHNTGEGEFAAPVVRTVAGAGVPTTNIMAIGDVDGDTDPDIVVAAAAFGPVTVLINEGVENFESSEVIHLEVQRGVSYRRSAAIALGDFDQDGRSDLALTNWGATSCEWGAVATVSVLLNSDTDVFRVPAHSEASSTYNVEGKAIIASQFDGNDLPDLAVIVGGTSSSGGDSLAVWRNPSDNFSGTQERYELNARATSVAAADLDGDGATDLAFALPYDSAVLILMNDGSGTFNQQLMVPTDEYYCTYLQLSDLNNDGSTDIVTAANDHVSVFLNDGNVTFQSAGQYSGSVERLALSDLDSDGDVDLVATMGSVVAIALNDGTGQFVSAGSYSAGDRPFGVEVADITGDGRMDLIVANPGGWPTYEGSLSIMIGRGDGTFIATGNQWFACGRSEVYARDLDGDGDNDLVSSAYRGLSVLLNQGNGVFDNEIFYSAGDGSRDCFVVADLDGNGVLDIATTGIDLIMCNLPDDLTGVDNRDRPTELPSEFVLEQNYPNPFNPSTAIRFDLPRRSTVTLEIINILGQKVRTLVSQTLPAGEHLVRWNGLGDSAKPLASGIYFYRLTAGDVVVARKMVLLK